MYDILFDEILGLGRHYYYIGQLEDAVNILGHGVEIAEHEDVSQRLRFDVTCEYGEALTRLAGVQTEDFELALSIADRVTKLAETDVQKGKAGNVLGNIYYQQTLNNPEPDFLKPRSVFQEAHELLKDTGDMQAIFWPLFHIGLTYQFTGEHEIALDYFRQTETIARENKLDLELSFTIRHVGFMLQSQQRFDEALAAQLESIAIREKIGFRAFLQMAYMAAAGVYEATGDNENALTYFENAQMIADEIGLQRLQMMVLMYYALLLIRSGRPNDAREKLKAAYHHAKTLDDKRAQARINNKLAELDD